jgi:putative endonuclease
VKQPAVYILASGRNGTLYIGVTSQLVQRIWQHKSNLVPGFTSKYQVHDLVYFELCDDMLVAIAREKQVKAGSRDKKVALIESVNPEWRDLYREVV